MGQSQWGLAPNKPNEEIKKMGKTNYLKYDPRADSTPELVEDPPKGVDLSKTIVLAQLKGGCPCGCAALPLSKGRTFGMGHDARYRGKLIRAHVAGITVTHQIRDTDTKAVALSENSPMSLAASHDWQPYLEAAKEREDARVAARRQRASKDLVAEATGPQVGDRKLIKIGRWEHTGEVVAVFDNGGTIEYEYVTKSGARKRHTVKTDSK